MIVLIIYKVSVWKITDKKSKIKNKERKKFERSKVWTNKNKN